jgi:tRNA1(Val) A37 N6-methylase TrmN6
MVCDFLTARHQRNSFDWVITNPPFKSAEEFVLKAMPIAGAQKTHAQGCRMTSFIAAPIC